MIRRAKGESARGKGPSVRSLVANPRATLEPLQPTTTERPNARRAARTNGYASLVSGGAQRNLVLILARDFASRLATAVFLVDSSGNLIYFNEAAEHLLGRPFEEGRSMSAAEWSTAFEPVSRQGEPLDLDELPLGVAIAQQEPAHRAMRIAGSDGVVRDIEVTAFPLFAHADEFVGAVAIFWEPLGGS